MYMRRRWRYRCRFTKATAFIRAAWGYYELYINGRKVGDRVMDPLFTDYDKKGVVYATYDVTDYFSTGSNAFGILLGNGWYSLPTRDVFRDARCELAYAARKSGSMSSSNTNRERATYRDG